MTMTWVQRYLGGRSGPWQIVCTCGNAPSALFGSSFRAQADAVALAHRQTHLLLNAEVLS